MSGKKHVKNFMARQGDLLFVQVEELPKKNLKSRPRNELGHLVCREGEAKNHFHKFTDEGVALLDSEDGTESYLQIEQEEALLTHEEHNPVEFKSGIYKMIIQREYSPQEIRSIID